MSDTGIERRIAPRTEADIPIRLTDDAHPARLVNISTSGICCTYGEAINEMTIVGITLELPGAPNGTKIKGAVVRCAKCRDMKPPTYELGIFFTELSPDNRRAIEGFVQSQVSENAGK